MVRFSTLDASGQGPFGPASHFHFHDGLNVIVGGNGSGKTTVFRLLQAQAHDRWELGGDTWREVGSESLPQVDHAQLPAKVRASLVFWGEEDGRYREGGKDADLCFLMTWPGLDHHRLDADLTEWVRRLFGTCGSWTTRTSALQVRLTAGGGVDLFVAGQRLCPTTLAMGEQALLHLARLAALRMQLDPARDWSLVVDRPLGALDRFFRAAVVSVLPELAKQVIVLLPPEEQEEASWQPDYVLDYEGRPEGVTRVVAMTSDAGA